MRVRFLRFRRCEYTLISKVELIWSQASNCQTQAVHISCCLWVIGWFLKPSWPNCKRVDNTHHIHTSCCFCAVFAMKKEFRVCVCLVYTNASCKATVVCAMKMHFSVYVYRPILKLPGFQNQTILHRRKQIQDKASLLSQLNTRMHWHLGRCSCTYNCCRLLKQYRRKTSSPRRHLKCCWFDLVAVAWSTGMTELR